MSTSPLRHSPPESRPYLVRSGRPSPVKRSPLVLWHLLSLDAPSVAALWTAFLAWCAGVSLRWYDPVAMFLAVWMLYAADRLLDAKPLFTEAFAPELKERHRFHHQHRRSFLTAILLAALPLLILLHLTTDAVLHLYVLLAGLLCVWLLIVHARPALSASSHRLPKELAVGLFFPAAVFIPTVARAPALRLSLLPDAVFFALLCMLNCLFLYAWEHPRGRSSAHASTRWAVRHLKALALAVTLLADGLFLILATLPVSGPRSHWRVFEIAHPAAPLLACSISAALLLVLHASRRKLSGLTLRSLADLVLLSPAPIMLAVFLGTPRR